MKCAECGQVLKTQLQFLSHKCKTKNNNQLHNIKIKQEGRKFELFLDDKKINGITSVMFKTDVEEFPQLAITLYTGENVEIEVELEEKEEKVSIKGYLEK